MTVTLCLVLLMLGSTPSGLSEDPLGRVWPSLPHLVSTLWESAGNCIGGFPSAPSVGCGLPYHISSLTLWESAGNCWLLLRGVFRFSLPHLVSTVWNSAGNCFRGVRVPPRSGVAFPTTSRLYCLEVCWQLHRGFSECPLGRV